ncbi:filament integrity protein FraC [Dolichospermum circinale]|uniref:filament integrity protein FraC n=1 Tax=Dolichospermum circinale TaxID=109265 RepID=UPI00232E5633|nr:filament integrity protein FraC [Dolichospermum circinale]MDB9466618.1 filament integrity protein fraC [Dolichospermum circinale CS-539/09]MDB9469635.1 filament integrity protein fraC [Dolichospermum circinale CS-539]
MSDELSLPIILPIGAIFFEILFLLAAIPVEASVLNKWLKFDKKTSIFYAITINVFSSVIGWIIFFMIEPILPTTIKSELINYVFFNKLKDTSISSLIILLSFTIFLATFIVKFLIMKMLIIVMDESGKKTEIDIISSQQRAIYMNIAKLQNTSLVTAILIANSLSYTAITIILLIRSLYSGR